MKKILLLAGMVGLGTVAASLQSCDKVKEEIVNHLDPFTYSQSDISFEAPPMPLTMEYTSPEETEVLNINEIIRKNSGLNVDIDNFSSITLQDATLHLKNGTNNANWTNMEYAEIQVNTDKGLNAGKDWITANVTIPDDASERFTDKTLEFPNVNLKEYLNGEGTVLHYRFKIKPRRPTLTSMQFDVTIRYSFKP